MPRTLTARLVAVAVLLLTALLTRRTALGMLIEAVGINPEASRLAGVRARTIIWTVYGFSGLCAGLAGLVIAANTNSVNANSLGLWIELDAILAVVIGGTSLMGGRFSILLSLVGALIIQAMNTGILLSGFPPEMNLILKAVLIALILVLQSPAFARAAGAFRSAASPPPPAARPRTMSPTSSRPTPSHEVPGR